MSSPATGPLSLPVLRGRGTPLNPANRFDRIDVVDDFEHVEHDAEYLASRGRVETVYLRDASQSVITSNDSPDVGFTHSLNPYRGCAHGCIYCYARPTHEYLGFSAGLDFETRVMVKPGAAGLLRGELMRPAWRPTVLNLSGVTDCYQPVERKLGITRACLEVLAEFRNPVSVITKNHLATRDADVLAGMAAWGGAMVLVSVTTLDNGLAATMEPRTSGPRRRLEAIRTLSQAGVPVGVMVSPVVPGLTDHEMPTVLGAAAEAGATFAAYTTLRLPGAVAGLFEDWLRRHHPDRAAKVLGRVRELRRGALNDSRFGSRMTGVGVWADHLRVVFHAAARRAGIGGSFPALSTEQFRRPGHGGQMELF